MLTDIRHTAAMLLGLVLLALVVACGGTKTPEEALTQRAEAAALELSNSDWLDAYN